MPPTTPRSIIHIVVGTFSAVTIIYILTCAACAIMRIDPPPSVSGMLKDSALVAMGALGAFLTSMKSQGKESLPEGAISATSTTSSVVETKQIQPITTQPIP